MFDNPPMKVLRIDEHEPIHEIRDKAKAEALAAACAAGDSEWTYKVETMPSGYFVVAVFDEDGYRLGWL